MRALVFYLLLTTGALAQTSITRILEQGLKEAVNAVAPVPAAETREVLEATATLLAKHVTFRPDGTATSTYFQQTSQWPVEWKKLVVTRVTSVALTDADRLNGVTLRCHASLACDASRDWAPETAGWSEWRPMGFALFPGAIVVEKKNGVISARGSGGKLPMFQPGPGPSIIDKAVIDPDKGLPPGMTRRR